MRLSAFILANLEPLLQEWEDFARSLGIVTASMSAKALRDHAELILKAIAVDMETAQSPTEQTAKSKGDAPAPPTHLPESAGASHGSERADDGFSLAQMVSEYRALRACVLRLWAREEAAAASPTPTPDSYQQQIRFHEATDEALAASILSYSDAVGQMFEAKASRRMAALGTLSAGLCHDMSHVLLPMRACLNALTHHDHSPVTDPLLDTLRSSVTQLGDLTKGLRALAMDPDDCAASPDSTLLHEWWTTAVSPLTWALPAGVRLHVDGLDGTDPALPPVRVPAHALMQAVYNLVQNAAHALGQRNAAESRRTGARPTGNIWITAGLETATPGATPTGAVHLTIRDDGPGMDKGTVARCTEAFFTTKPHDQGTGLGLYLVRNAVERYGGKLLVESDVGEGTLFTLLLPTADAAEG